jgi:hypothetical protein
MISQNDFPCTICGKVFNNEGKLISHSLWHRPGYGAYTKTEEYSNRCKEAAKKYCEKLVRKNQNNYYLEPNKCQSCSSIIPYEKRMNKFCNSSCAAKLNNTKRPSRKKPKVKKLCAQQAKPVKERQLILPFIFSKTFSRNSFKPSICEICNGVTHARIIRKTCGREQCVKTRQSVTASDRLRKRHASSEKMGSSQKSYLEKSFEEWLVATYPKISYEDEKGFWNPILRKNYVVDFIFPDLNLIVELDGTQHRNTIEKDRIRDEYLTSLGYKVFRITHQEYQKKTKHDELCYIFNSL